MKWLAFLVVFGWAGTASADMPNYNPQVWCRSVASASGGFSQVILNGCLQQEQESYDRLRPLWADLPEQMRTWCDQVARASGGGSYVILDGCVEQERQSGRDASQFQFRR
jgi:hypothetical protein